MDFNNKVGKKFYDNGYYYGELKNGLRNGEGTYK